jgi:hypothetical protein
MVSTFSIVAAVPSPFAVHLRLSCYRGLLAGAPCGTGHPVAAACTREAHAGVLASAVPSFAIYSDVIVGNGELRVWQPQLTGVGALKPVLRIKMVRFLV